MSQIHKNLWRAPHIIRVHYLNVMDSIEAVNVNQRHVQIVFKDRRADNWKFAGMKGWTKMLSVREQAEQEMDLR